MTYVELFKFHGFSTCTLTITKLDIFNVIFYTLLIMWMVYYQDDFKSWQEGFRALLPNININFAGKTREAYINTKTIKW